jgi:hypothetical protein
METKNRKATFKEEQETLKCICAKLKLQKDIQEFNKRMSKPKLDYVFNLLRGGIAEVYKWDKSEGTFKKVSEIEFKPSLKLKKRGG